MHQRAVVVNVCEWCGQRARAHSINVFGVRTTAKHQQQRWRQRKIKNQLFANECCSIRFAWARCWVYFRAMLGRHSLHNSNYSRQNYRCVIVEATSVYLTWITNDILCKRSARTHQPKYPAHSHTHTMLSAHAYAFPNLSFGPELIGGNYDTTHTVTQMELYGLSAMMLSATATTTRTTSTDAWLDRQSKREKRNHHLCISFHAVGCRMSVQWEQKKKKEENGIGWRSWCVMPQIEWKLCRSFVWRFFPSSSFAAKTKKTEKLLVNIVTNHTCGHSDEQQKRGRCSSPSCGTPYAACVPCVCFAKRRKFSAIRHAGQIDNSVRDPVMCSLVVSHIVRLVHDS